MSTLPVNLNKGLDFTSPALSKEPGSLVACLNYEFTSIEGLGRLDGYERYDGWVNGAIADIWQVPITIDDAGAFAAVVPNSSIMLMTQQGNIVAGLYVSHTSTTLTYIPLTKDRTVVRIGDQLIVDGGTASDATATATSFALHTTLSTEDYVSLVRSTASVYRTAVQDSTTPVCGVQWFRNNLLEVRDAPSYTITGVAESFAQIGDTMRIGTITGLVIEKQASPFKVWIEPYVTGTASTALSIRNKDGTAASSATATTVVESLAESDWAYMVAMETPETGMSRAVKRMNRAVIVTFDNGTQAAGVDPTVGTLVNTGPLFVSNYYNLVIKSIILESGSWAAGTAAGRMELVPTYSLDPSVTSGLGAYNKIAVGDVVRVSGNSIFTVDSIIRTKLPGTRRLRVFDSHYVGFNANFYGEDTQTEAYMANGANRAVWAVYYNKPLIGYQTSPSTSEIGYEKYYSYGNIYTGALEFLDNPKFVSRHARLSLAAGFAGGMVAVSVVNEPYNFSGLDGAQSLPTGDEVTGLLETVGDSTLIFGRRSISRIAGVADGIQSTTISPDSGALPYTCVNVGRVPMYADQNGVGLLEQSQTYSDFVGVRASSKVHTELLPKLVTSIFDTEVGGVHCAIPVRSKNQYRLFLRSGDVYSFCLSGSPEPLIAVSNYSNDGTPRVPLAWSSTVQDNGKERIHAVWDSFFAKYSSVDQDGEYNPVNSKRVYELDSGWGFDGATFEHSFELSHLFTDGAANFVGINSMRLFGKSHGVASLKVRARGVEWDFEQELTTASQDISLPPRVPAHYSRDKKDQTSYVDHANWGLGVSLRFEGSNAKNLTTTEPSHLIQVIVLRPRIEGVTDA